MGGALERGAASAGESSLHDREFAFFAEAARVHAGIVLGPAKRAMLAGRLSKVLTRRGETSYVAYAERLRLGAPADIREFVDAVTTNLTSFFRESYHFDYLRDELLPALMQRHQESRRLRIWCAGCASGEEPYSVAMVLHEALKEQTWDARILATDIDETVLATASRAIYPADRLQPVPERYRRLGFERGLGARAGSVRVKPEVAGRVTVRRLNLMEPWPMHGPYDAIFCRNVVIYFDKPTQRRLFDRFADLLDTDGRLFIGHSESLFQVTDRFASLGRTIYRKTA